MKTKLLSLNLRNKILSVLSPAIICLFLIFALCPEPSALSQIPQGFNYQAIARDGSGNPIISTPLQVRLTLQSDSAGTNVIWQEMHSSVSTNSFGLFTLVMGRGTRQSGTALTFDAIDWSVTPVFIKTEVNYGGWKDMGTTRLWSVPYAMKAGGTDQWQTNGTNIFRTIGNVGIGTATPSSKLEVRGVTKSFTLSGANATSGQFQSWTEGDAPGQRAVYSFYPTFEATPGGYVPRREADIVGGFNGGNWGTEFLSFNVGNNGSANDVEYLTSEKMRITGNGNIGIGTSTPFAKLNILETANTGITYPLFLQNLSADWTATEKGVGIRFGRNSLFSQHGFGTILGTIADADAGHGKLELIGGPGNVPHLTITWNGNVGIGTANPSALIDVKTSANFHFGAFYGTAGAASIGAFNDGFSAWQPLSINPGGQVWFLGGAVGIGTSSPAYPLHVVGNARIQGSLALDNNLNAGGYGSGANLGGFCMEIGGPSPTATNGIATIWLHHHGAIAHQLRYTSGTLFLEAAGNGYGTSTTPTLQIGGSLYAAVNGGNVGIGTSSATSKVIIQPPATWDDNTPLFEVKNKSGVTVFAVYNNGIRAFVQTNSGKGVKGGFAIGGFDPSKAGNVNLMSISPDSIRFYIDNSTTKATKGGFAIGSFNTSKASNQDFMYVTPQSSAKGQYNTFLGYQTGISNTGSYNAFMGYQAGMTNSTGNHNVFIGYNTGKGNTTGAGNVLIGNNSGVTAATLSNSTFLGTSTGLNTTGIENTFVGCYSGQQTTTGRSNTFVGTYSGWTNNSGNYNTHIGYYAGGASLGSSNVFIGNQAGQGLTGSNQLYIDDGPTMKPLIWGDFLNRRVVINGNASDNPLSFTFYANGWAGGDYGWNVPSDIRFKKNVETIVDPIAKVMSLRGVYFNWKDTSKTDKQQMGFIAQEAEGIIPQVVNKSNGFYSMDYAPISALLVEGMKEQQQQIKAQQKQIESQNEKIDRLEKLVGEMQSALERAGVK